jgi:acyl-CoA synthetase
MLIEDIERERKERCNFWRSQEIYADFTYAQAIRDAVAIGGHRKLVFHSALHPAEMSVAEINAVAESVAAGFEQAGLKEGDRLAVMLPTWRQASIAYLAAFKLGLVVVPIVAIYGSREVGFILRQTKARAIIIPDIWRGRSYPEIVKDAGSVPELNTVIIVGDSIAGTVNWLDLEAAEGRYRSATARGDDTCLIVYTSGTTADPKGVRHSHNTMLCDLNFARMSGALDMMPADPEGANLAVFPAGHIAGFLAMMRPFTMPVCDTVYMDQWIPEDGARLIDKYRIASTVGTPIFLTSLMNAAETIGADLSSLKRFSLGATNITPQNIRLTDQLGFPGGRTYGMSEHTVISTSVGEPFEKRARTDGRVTPRNEVRIVDDLGEELPTGQAGEITTRGPRLFMGYVDDQLDIPAFLPGGWFRTGDIGVMDSEGYLTVTDRKKDIIIRGGENISAKEVEDALATLPGVIESAVTSMPDVIMGERICAFIVAAAGKQITLKEVDVHFRALGVTRQKTPERVVLVDDLPRTPSGKVRKDVLRSQAGSYVA